MKWQIRGVSPGHKSSRDTGRLSDVIREAPCRGVRVVSGGACGQGSERLHDREGPSGAAGDTFSADTNLF